MANEKRLIKVCDATKVYNGIALYAAENAYLNDTALDVLKMVASWLNEAPEVDAVEVKHGRWINSHTVAFTEECSQCGFCVDWTENGMLHNYNYCPNCGASMRVGVENE